MYLLPIAPRVEDVDALISDEVAEARVIEYKSELPGGADGDKKEFLADVSSLANSDGGHVLFGIVAEQGIPRSICGVGNVGMDAEILRLESMLRDGVRPRIEGITPTPLRTKDDLALLSLHVPRSWTLPHMVTFKRWSRFYRRTSGGKHEMDVDELRNAFLGAAEFPERMRRFRDERVAGIWQHELPVYLSGDHSLIVHIIPYSSMTPGHEVDTGGLEASLLPPMGSSGFNSRYNFDGFLTYAQDDERNIYSYVQAFRSGSIEAASSGLFYQVDGRWRIPGLGFEKQVIASVSRYLLVLRDRLQVSGPVVIFVSLTGVSGMEISVDDWRSLDEGRPIDRPTLAGPEVILEGRDDDLTTALRPTFDAIWNAAGWPGSRYYDEEGRRAERRR